MCTQYKRAMYHKSRQWLINKWVEAYVNLLFWWKK